MKKIFAFASILIFVFNCKAQNLQVISDRYSYEVNKTIWEKASVDALREKEKTDQSVSGKKHNYSNYFYFKASGLNSLPQIIVQEFSTPTNFYVDYKSRMKSNGLNVIIDNNQSRIDRLIEKVKIGEVICNDYNQTIAFKAEIKRNDKIEVTNYTFIFFTSNKLVQFVYSSVKSEFDKFVSNFLNIITSFKWI